MGQPRTMCRNHLLGEHKEIHQLLGQLKRGMSISGYITNNCIEISSIEKRHNSIVKEMKSRGYNHHSPILKQGSINKLASYLPEKEQTYKIDIESSDQDRFGRCSKCLELKR